MGVQNCQKWPERVSPLSISVSEGVAVPVIRAVFRTTKPLIRAKVIKFTVLPVPTGLEGLFEV